MAYEWRVSNRANSTDNEKGKSLAFPPGISTCYSSQGGCFDWLLVTGYWVLVPFALPPPPQPPAHFFFSVVRSAAVKRLWDSADMPCTTACVEPARCGERRTLMRAALAALRLRFRDVVSGDWCWFLTCGVHGAVCFASCTRYFQHRVALHTFFLGSYLGRCQK